MSVYAFFCLPESVFLILSDSGYSSSCHDVKGVHPQFICIVQTVGADADREPLCMHPNCGDQENGITAARHNHPVPLCEEVSSAAAVGTGK
jgi:hypothetical protein